MYQQAYRTRAGAITPILICPQTRNVIQQMKSISDDGKVSKTNLLQHERHCCIDNPQAVVLVFQVRRKSPGGALPIILSLCGEGL